MLAVVNDTITRQACNYFVQEDADLITSIFYQTPVIDQLINFDALALDPFAAGKVSKLALTGVDVSEITLAVLKAA
jgi:hypothetical protein